MTDENDINQTLISGVFKTLSDAILPSVKLLKLRDNAPDKPTYETEGSAGADLRAATSVIISPGDTRLVPTGYAIELPSGYEGQIRSRSGMALRNGVIVFNAPATIDSDYTGELMVMLINLSSYTYEVNFGDKIAQLVISYAPQAKFVNVDTLVKTNKGPCGFGSTGNQ